MKKKLIGAAASLALVGGMWLGGAGVAEAQSKNTPLCLDGHQRGVTYQEQAPGKKGASRIVREPIQDLSQSYYKFGYRYEITHDIDGITQVWEEYSMPLPGGDQRYRSTMIECTQEDRDDDNAIEVNPAPRGGGGGGGAGGAIGFGAGPTVLWAPSDARTGTVTVGEVENL